MTQPLKIAVEVTVDRRTPPIYPDDEADSTTHNFYLEVKAGDTYEIKVSCADSLFEGHEALLVRVDVDGSKLRRKVIYSERNKSIIINGPNEVKSGAWTKYPLIFTEDQIGKLL